MNLIRIRALVGHYLNTVKRNKSRLIDLVVWPFLDVAVFGFMTKFVGESTGFSQITAIFLGSLVFWHFFSRISSEVYQQIFDDVSSRNLKNILITPLSDSELIVSMAIGAIIKVLISLAVTLAGVTLFYELINVDMAAWQVLVLMTSGLAIGFLISALLFLMGTKAMSFGWVLTGVIQPFCCVFYSRNVLPEVVKVVTYLVPVSYVFESYRGENVAWWLPLTISVVMLLVSIIVFLSMIKLSRKTGVLMRI